MSSPHRSASSRVIPRRGIVALVAVAILGVVVVRVVARATPSAEPNRSSASATASPAAADRGARPLVPVTTAIDGDTVDVRVGGRRERVRLIGLDAPEMNPAECQAAQSRQHLAGLIGGGSVWLDADPTQADRDTYGRLLRHLVLADGRVAAESVIAAGLATEYTYDEPYRYRDRFVAAQAAAKRAGRGIWGRSCAVAPLITAPTTTTTDAPGDCDIKGNIANDGEMIYHVPGQEHYEATVVSPSKGERWFCTEADAVAAGWRTAKV